MWTSWSHARKSNHACNSLLLPTPQSEAVSTLATCLWLHVSRKPSGASFEWSQVNYISIPASFLTITTTVFSFWPRLVFTGPLLRHPRKANLKEKTLQTKNCGSTWWQFDRLPLSMTALTSGNGLVQAERICPLWIRVIVPREQEGFKGYKSHGTQNSCWIAGKGLSGFQQVMTLSFDGEGGDSTAC